MCKQPQYTSSLYACIQPFELYYVLGNTKWSWNRKLRLPTPAQRCRNLSNLAISWKPTVHRDLDDTRTAAKRCSVSCNKVKASNPRVYPNWRRSLDFLVLWVDSLLIQPVQCIARSALNHKLKTWCIYSLIWPTREYGHFRTQASQ